MKKKIEWGKLKFAPVLLALGMLGVMSVMMGPLFIYHA